MASPRNRPIVGARIRSDHGLIVRGPAVGPGQWLSGLDDDLSWSLKRRRRRLDVASPSDGDARRSEAIRARCHARILELIAARLPESPESAESPGSPGLDRGPTLETPARRWEAARAHPPP